MRTTPITYEDILANDESGHLSKRILVEGEGGVGKTTLSAKIAWDWCQGRILLDLDMVIVIPLRDVTDHKSIGAIVKSYLSDFNEATPDQIDAYISSNLNKILLVFDGFDEFSEDIQKESDSEVIRILALDQYKSCKVIVTTRPWRSHVFKVTKKLAETYTFISVEGFNEKNLVTYITRYFQIREKKALGESLISFMDENDIIRSNMAPFPIYCAMLCLMWKDVSEEKRKEMTKLQTFSEMFGEMILFLKEHYASKVCERLGSRDKIATREKRRHDVTGPYLVESVVSFPHKLFQEYVGGVYIANIYASDRTKYDQLKQTLLPRYEEFRYLLYFTSALGNELGLDIIKDLLRWDDEYFCIDVAFECHTEEAAKTVGEGWKEYHISSNMPEHTKSGVAFIVRCDQAKLLSIDEVNCGKTTSRELAEGMCSSSVLRKVTIMNSKFHADFYKIIGDKTSTCQTRATWLLLACIPCDLCESQLLRGAAEIPGMLEIPPRIKNA
ncbi:LOW QUALITY PROTEIN: NACHT, LRR and PYD domains-containing protein 6-like [Diadema setosum]|uniref:LOW QUALITY PROTEIN: NACHT, LRR and PYD domains-containing protein 6-like n=1 Tax=Diadema setosum TaxID=31175 RepID=UPI003B3B9405